MHGSMNEVMRTLLAVFLSSLVVAAPAQAQPHAHSSVVAKKEYVQPYKGWLQSTRWCESRSNYRINTGNGFYGAYQFTIQSWRGVGGHGMPHKAPKYEQDYRAVKLLKLQGRGAWPNCG